MTKAILVTGATGYIGSHVCKHLKNAGYAVIGVDLVKRDHALKHMHLYVQADYASVDCFKTLVDYPGISAIVHCAGTSLVGPSMIDPGAYYTNNVAKTIAFLDFIRAMNRKPDIIFSSSAAVYGAPNVDVIHEDQSVAPISPYGQTKAMIEQIIADYCRAYDMSAVSLRYFNACGADAVDHELGQEAGATHIIARLLESVKNKEQFTLYGNDYNTPDGTCVRDYVHVDDLANAHKLAIEYLESNFGHTVINLGTNEGYSNQQVIQSVEKLVGSVDVATGPRREGDPDRLVASNTRASELLNWTPTHSDLGTIVSSAWKWYNNPPKSVDITV